MKNSNGNRSTKQTVIPAQRSLTMGVVAMFSGILFASGWACAQEAAPAKPEAAPSKGKPPVVGAYSRTFAAPTNFYGMNMIGWVAFYSTNNNVEFGRLAADTVMWGKTSLPAGTGIHFTPEGKPVWCFLSKDWKINGHLFRKGHDWMTCFHPSGELESGGLVNVEVIDGIPCASTSAGPRFFRSNPRTHFYEDGKLKSAEVAKTITYRGQTIKKGKRIQLKPDGSIESIK